MRVIIPAAGKGSRLSTSPDAPPKALYQIDGHCLIDIVLGETSFIAPEDTYIVVGYKADEVRRHCGGKYHYAEQKEQLGTGHAVLMCEEQFKGYEGTVLVTFGDMPLFRGEVMKQMCALREATNAACVLLTAENPELTMWARIIRDDKRRFARIVEGKDCTSEQARTKELFAGVLAFDSRTLFALLPTLGDNNIQHEYYLTEIPEMMAKMGLTVETLQTDDPADLFGINRPDDVPLCREILKKRGKI